jgi:hypothetical protein
VPADEEAFEIEDPDKSGVRPTAFYRFELLTLACTTVISSNHWTIRNGRKECRTLSHVFSSLRFCSQAHPLSQVEHSKDVDSALGQPDLEPEDSDGTAQQSTPSHSKQAPDFT